MALIQFPGRLGDVREKMALASIYPNHWRAVLRLLERLFPGSSAMLERIGSDDAGTAPSFCATSHRSLRRVVGARWDAQGLDYLSIGTIFRMSELPETGLPSCRHRDEGFGRSGAGIVLHRRDSCLWVLSVQAPHSLGDRYDAAIATLLHRLAADLRRSFLIAHGLGTADQPDRATIETSWDQLSIGVALLSADLRPLAANTAAEELVSTRRFFAPLGRHGSLRAAVNNDNSRLRSAASRIVYGESDVETLAIQGVRCAHSLPMTLRAVGRRSFAVLPCIRSAVADESLVAIIGPPQTTVGETSPIIAGAGRSGIASGG